MKTASLAEVDLRSLVFRHRIEVSNVRSIVKYALAAKRWSFPPILVHGVAARYRVLDGHHRARAAQLVADAVPALSAIPAWVVSEADYNALLLESFQGAEPDRISSVRQMIACGDTDGDAVAGWWSATAPGAAAAAFEFTDASLQVIADHLRALSSNRICDVDLRVPPAVHPGVRYRSRISITTCAARRPGRG